MTNCTAQDNNNTVSPGWAIGRFCGNDTWGTSDDTYIGNNTPATHGTPGQPEQNSGEQCMWEGNIPVFRGTPTAATATTVTFGNLTTDYSTTYDAMIMSGTGVGQHRLITGYGGGAITVSPAWNVVPDTTSSVMITTLVDHAAMYHNSFSGKPLVLNSVSPRRRH